VLLNDGCMVALGKVGNISDFSSGNAGMMYGGGGYSEYVVKNPERVKIRYVVELRQKSVEELKQEKKKENKSNA